MVKGISRQVIVVQSPDRKLFEQAIFILKDDVVNQKGITDDALLKEAKRLIAVSTPRKGHRYFLAGAIWAGAGAFVTGIAWLVSALI